MDNIAQVLCT